MPKSNLESVESSKLVYTTGNSVQILCRNFPRDLLDPYRRFVFVTSCANSARFWQHVWQRVKNRKCVFQSIPLSNVVNAPFNRSFPLSSCTKLSRAADSHERRTTGRASIDANNVRREGGFVGIPRVMSFLADPARMLTRRLRGLSLTFPRSFRRRLSTSVQRYR